MNQSHPFPNPHGSSTLDPAAARPPRRRIGGRMILVVGAAVLGWLALIGSCVAWVWRDIGAMGESVEAFARACGTQGSDERCAGAVTGPSRLGVAEIRAGFGNLEALHGPFEDMAVRQFCRSGVGDSAVGQIGGTMQFERGGHPIVINLAKVDGAWRVSEIGASKDKVTDLCSD